MMNFGARVRQLTTLQDVVAHSHRLLDPHRDRPVLVATSSLTGEVWIDVDHLADELGDLADVVVIPSGDLTREVERILPPKTNVFGGAGRVYPVGDEWHDDPYVARLRFCYDAEQGREVTAALLDDALRHVRVSAKSEQQQPEPVAVTGTVAMVIPPDRALVRVDDDGTVVLRTDTDFPSTDVAQLLAPGMPVKGWLSPDGRSMVADLERLSAGQALAHLSVGRVVPAKVTSADAKTAVVSLFPGVHTRTSRPAGVRVGDVIAVRIAATGRPDGQGWALEPVMDADASAVSPAPPLLDGGPGWLVLPPAEELELEREAEGARDVDDEPVDDVSAAVPVPGPVGDAPLRLELERALRELSEKDRALRETRDDRGRLYAELDELAQENAQLRADLRKARERRSPTTKVLRPAAEEPVDESSLFCDPVEQLRFDVYVAWARRIPAGEKAQRPLPDYDVADSFVPSLECTQGLDRAKVLDVIVEVLTGLADSMPGRELHRLRQGHAGSPAITHPELGTAWRASIQVKTASARRLHFWRGNDGRVTLAQVGLHDDMEISA